MRLVYSVIELKPLAPLNDILFHTFVEEEAKQRVLEIIRAQPQKRRYLSIKRTTVR